MLVANACGIIVISIIPIWQHATKINRNKAANIQRRNWTRVVDRTYNFARYTQNFFFFFSGKIYFRYIRFLTPNFRSSGKRPGSMNLSDKTIIYCYVGLTIEMVPNNTPQAQPTKLTVKMLAALYFV